MKTIIIDDEPKARRLLSNILTECCPLVTEIHEAENLMEGVKQIRIHQPDVVFLDIEMPDYLGIDIGDFLAKEEMNFHIIFTTAYSHYAVKAFEVNAIDYLLKPIRPKQINEALHKVQTNINKTQIAHQLASLKEFVEHKTIKKIAIPVSNGILFVKVETIICLEADGMYTKVHLLNDSVKTISKPLKYFVSLLEGVEIFFRPHRSFLINTNFIKQYIKKDGHTVVMENDITAPISRDKREAFMQVINTIT